MLEFGREEVSEVSVEGPPPKPQIKLVEARDTYGRFSVEPLERGYGTTVGNPLRRALLSSIPGTAVTWVKIDGVQHEYSTIPHVKEDVVEILLNVKAIRLRSLSDRPGKLRLEVSGEGRVCSGDIVTSSDFEIINPELHLATLDSAAAHLSMELNVEQGKGYVRASEGDGLPIGVLPVDAIFSPVRKVSYVVERTRVGQVTDYERLVLDVWTDGTITPVEAVRQAASILANHFFLFSSLASTAEGMVEGTSRALSIPAEQYSMPVEKLELSARTLNCLKRAHINKVGEVLEMSSTDLLKIRNFGEKSLEELYDRLREMGLTPGEAEEPASALATEEEPVGPMEESGEEE